MLFNIGIFGRILFNTSLVLLVDEPAIRQRISNTMVSTCSLRPRVTRSDRAMVTSRSLSTDAASAPMR